MVFQVHQSVHGRADGLINVQRAALAHFLRPICPIFLALPCEPLFPFPPLALFLPVARVSLVGTPGAAAGGAEALLHLHGD